MVLSKFIPLIFINHDLFANASLKGLGSYYQGSVYTIPLLPCFNDILSIVHLRRQILWWRLDYGLPPTKISSVLSGVIPLQWLTLLHII